MSFNKKSSFQQNQNPAIPFLQPSVKEWAELIFSNFLYLINNIIAKENHFSEVSLSWFITYNQKLEFCI
jgi:hypothetical protein